jgi:hypothetical protein
MIGTSKLQRLIMRRPPSWGGKALCSMMSTSSTNNLPPEDATTIVQGPSLLINTGKYRPSPSMFFLPGLRSLPFWTAPTRNRKNGPNIAIAYGEPTVSEIVNHLESNFETIREEYMHAVMGMGSKTDLNPENPSVSKPLEPDYDVNLKGEHASDKLHSGSWDWHSYILNGVVQPNFQKSCPKTTAIIQELNSNLFLNNPFGFSFFSTLHEKSYIKPHHGPMNLRLRIHLPLIVPKDIKPDAFSNKPQTKCGIRVGNQIRSWEEGKALVLDDSYEHEVWNETKEMRVILLVDIWHPDVTFQEREKIGNMFHFAKEQGWMKS